MTRPVRDGIIATVGGGLILALVFALWSAARHVVVRAAEATWSVLWRTVGLPLWVVVAVSLVAMLLLVRWASARSRRLAPTKDVGSPARVHVGPQHWAILKALAAADGEPRDLGGLRQEIGTSQLRLTALLDDLYSVGLVEPQQDYVLGSQVILTRKGRDLLIEHGIVD